MQTTGLSSSSALADGASVHGGPPERPHNTETERARIRPAHDPTADTPPQPLTASGKSKLRKRSFAAFLSALAVVGCASEIWTVYFAADVETTDNAYTNVEVVQITPLVSASVARVRVNNSQQVRAGDVLVELDDTDLRLAAQEAEAAFVQAQRKFKQLEANDESLAGQEQARLADEATAQADMARAQADLDKALKDQDRTRKLSAGGWATAEKLDETETVVKQSRAAIAQAQARIAQARAAQTVAAGARRANRVLIDDAFLEKNPEVAAARAKLEQAQLDLSRATIRAPVDGVIDQRKVAIGQRLQAGTPIMTLVPIQSMYVDANFKEGQLSRVMPGQSATLISDLYGPDVVYHGRVVGFAGGTGSAFAAIPAQNATGNWIKVVQRLPVRIALNADELSAHPLRVGLSMRTTIDIPATP